MALVEQELGDCTADIAGAAGNEDAQRGTPLGKFNTWAYRKIERSSLFCHRAAGYVVKCIKRNDEYPWKLGEVEAERLPWCWEVHGKKYLNQKCKLVKVTLSGHAHYN
jgi:hypothetical protein